MSEGAAWRPDSGPTSIAGLGLWHSSLHKHRRGPQTGTVMAESRKSGSRSVAAMWLRLILAAKSQPVLLLLVALAGLHRLLVLPLAPQHVRPG